MHPPNALKALDRSHPRYPSPDKNPERGSLEKDQLAFKIDPTACGQARRHGCAHRSRLSPQADVRIDPLFTMSDNTRPSCGFDRRATDAEFKMFRTSHAPDWWSQTGSNRRPPACKAGALPTELWPPQRDRQPATGTEALTLPAIDLGWPENGGPGSTRTIDLTLIRGAL